MSAAETRVLELLGRAKHRSDLLWHNGRVTDNRKDAEIDVLLGLPGAGFVVVEVKGGQLTHDGQRWRQRSTNGEVHDVDPVRQARDAKYLLRTYVENDPRWGHRGRVRWAHAVVAPFTDVPADFALPDCPRSMIFGRGDLDQLVERLAEIPVAQESSNRQATADDVQVLHEILHGRGHPQTSLLGAAEEREVASDLLTRQQAVLLQVATTVPRLEVRGGAGSGKTWLALEQTRRLARAGQRVALLCYSRGLATYLRQVVDQYPRRARPAYTGTFHGLGLEHWGAAPPDDPTDTDYWDRRLPAAMIDIADALPLGQRFDAIVVDEAQDLATDWWAVVRAALRDPETGGLYLFSDEGQRIFQRSGLLPESVAVFTLEHNLRNSRPICESLQGLAAGIMRPRGGLGPPVRLVPCSASDAVSTADDQVDVLLDAGWRPEDIALLTTGTRHPEHASRLAAGVDAYWASYWDTEQVFYGSVLGFKGLERRAVVLAVNSSGRKDLDRERLYVGMSRATDELVLCGDPAYLTEIGGTALLNRLHQ